VSGFEFAQPGWVHAFWGLLAFVGLLVYLERRRGDALERLVHPALQTRLVEAPPAWRRMARIALVGLCLAASIVALMRPQWGIGFTQARSASAELMICLDVSRSMLAEDVAPNRLERAKAEIVDLLGYLRGDRVGLIAFAGRATVLAPMTPDFGFLRLVLESTGPESVARGGTRLEEPIRKAVAGFDPASDAARVILLITDGEDQDSFPIEAARAAREAGVRVIAIGYGSEAGSPIYVTDPRSGARSMLRDADGEPVTSRLDGDTLREIVRETRGAYIPAGTGVLDLESIYAEYLQGLLRSESSGRGVPVREEGYQWALLVALLALAGSVWVSGPAAAGRARALLCLVLFCCAVAATPRAYAQEADGSESLVVPDSAMAEASTAVGEQSAEQRTDAEASEPTQTPREVYNSGFDALAAADLENAERRFRMARSDGAQDPELRFRATYNLGLAAARRAESQRSEQPEAALQMYYAAADRFRDAVRQRPDDAESRHNLEVVLQRALLLADEIARQREGGLEEQIAKLIERQRQILARLSGLLVGREVDSSYEQDPGVQREYRAVAGDQRVLLADSDGLARQVGAERAALDANPTPAAPATPAPAQGPPPPTAEQLDAVLVHLDGARDRMGRARSQLRRRQGSRAYRRGVAALEELKRAQDALRDPMLVLTALTRDALELAAPLRSWAAGAAAAGSAGGSEPESELPAWQSGGILSDQEASLGGRSDELATRLGAVGLGAEDPTAGASSGASAAAPTPGSGGAGSGGAGSGGAGPGGPEADATEAAPRQAAAGWIARAADAFRAAGEQIESSPSRAPASHFRGVRALLEAQERLLGLKQLIELAYRDERSLEADLSAPDSVLAPDPGSQAGQDPDASIGPAQRLELRRAVQDKNRARMQRLIEQIERERKALPKPPPEGEDPGEAARKRLEAAGPLALDASRQMEVAAIELRRDAPRVPRVENAVQKSLEPLGTLRRLFFSITELLRDTLERQVELADDTRDVATLEQPAAKKDRAALLSARQAELLEIARSISEALAEQAEQSGSAGAAEPEAAKASEIFREASGHVSKGVDAMGEALPGFAADPFEFPTIEEPQQRAASELAEALALLVPPEEQPKEQPESDPSEGSDSQQQQQQQAGEEERERGDAAQLLQQVRDREAQRRREQAEQRPSGYETVERDW